MLRATLSVLLTLYRTRCEVILVLPLLKAGQRVMSAEIESRHPMFARKASNTTVSASTTLVDDADLHVDLLPNSTYLVRARIMYTGSSTGDISITWGTPAGSSTGIRFDYGPSASNSNPVSGAMRSSVNNWATVLGYGATTDATVFPAITEYGTITTGDTGGVLQLRYAQTTASGVLTVLAGSYLTVDRIELWSKQAK